MLQRWLTRICEDPVVIKDDELRSFVESEFGVSALYLLHHLSSHFIWFLCPIFLKYSIKQLRDPNAKQARDSVSSAAPHQTKTSISNKLASNSQSWKDFSSKLQRRSIGLLEREEVEDFNFVSLRWLTRSSSIAISVSEAEQGNKFISVATTEVHPPLAGAMRKFGRVNHIAADISQAQVMQFRVLTNAETDVVIG